MISGNGIQLSEHVAKPEGRKIDHLLVICHSFPAQRSMSVAFGETFPELADRLASDTGWCVVTFDFRGTGESTGEFSLQGWLDDINAVVAHVRESLRIDDVWLAGFGTGGSLAIVAASHDETIRGAASFGSPAHFDDWAEDPKACLDRARESGAIRSKDFPPDINAWAQEFSEIRPENVIAKIPPRPLMLVHGSHDEVVSDQEARLLCDAAGPQAELRIIAGAGHDLRHDPRAVAILSGWLDRQNN
jgi:pimeloyl-ACP methyl ester carboxylesterase